MATNLPHKTVPKQLKWLTAALLVFVVSLCGYLGNYLAAARLDIVRLAELGDADGVDYILRWHPSRVSEHGMTLSIKDPAQEFADATSRTKRECTALHVAANRGDIPMVLLLLEASPDPNGNALA